MMKREESERIPGITGSTLKIIAIVCMLIDHIGAFILERYMYIEGIASCTTVDERTAWVNAHKALFIFDRVSRSIGRIAFPIFCFLLIEGFFYTRSRVKYLVRLLVFSIISDIPFDLVHNGEAFDFGKQNVFFTLALGLIVIWIVDTIYKKLPKKLNIFIFRFLILALISAVFMYLAYLMHTDYRQYGVAAIALMYFYRINNEVSIVAAVAVLSVQSFNELWALLIIPLIRVYNGKRGLKMKYIFYIIYPLHLFIYYLIKEYILHI